MTNQICRISGSGFEISSLESKLHSIFGTPTPTLCPSERSRRRLAFCNDRNIYWRNCDLTGERILSIFSPDKSLKVYSESAYWSDKWDAQEFAREMDFSRPFFEQWAELRRAVPNLAGSNCANENSDYVSHSGWNKNCYLIFYSDHNQDCLYSTHSFNNRDIADCSYVNRSELCYECVASSDNYLGLYLFDCKHCSECSFMRSCIGCMNCFGCVGLRDKSFCFYNQQLSKEQYLARLKSIDLSSRESISHQLGIFQAFSNSQPFRAITGVRNENVSGNYIDSCKGVLNSFHAEHSRDCIYISDCSKCIDCVDMDGWGGTGAELIYECQTVGEGAYRICLSHYCWDGVRDLTYCDFCTSSHDLFGCVGMRHAEYSILNKRYSPDDYNSLRQRIVEHMKKTNEWGENFPAWASPFAYNESKAQQFFPLTKEEVSSRGLRWRDTSKVEPVAEKKTVPNLLHSGNDSLTRQVYACTSCGKGMRIIESELALHIRLGICLPDTCAECRHVQRRSKIGPRSLRGIQCAKCTKLIQTSLEEVPGRQIWCEECYLAHAVQ